MEQNINKTIENIKAKQQDLHPRADVKKVLMQSFETKEKTTLVRYWYAAAAVFLLSLASFWLFSDSNRYNVFHENEVVKTESKPVIEAQVQPQTPSKYSAPIVAKTHRKAIKTTTKRTETKLESIEKPIDISTVDEDDIAATFHRKNPNMTWEIETEDVSKPIQKQVAFWDVDK
jgi:hypothetical protein